MNALEVVITVAAAVVVGALALGLVRWIRKYFTR